MTLPNLRWARALSGATVLVVSLLACSGAEPELTAFPPPTGDEVVVVPPGHEEERLGSRRKQWIQRMHRAAPDVDWRAIERENGARAQERRNAAVRAAGSSQILKATSPWSEVGSSNQAGRMHCVSISSDKTKLYAGSDRGGVWRGSLTGAGWTPLADNLYGGANEVLTVPSTTPGAPEILFVFRDDGFVRVSVDDGATWTTPTGLGGLNAIRGVARLADAANTIVFLGRLGSVGVKTAIFASNNGGVSFSKRWTSNASWASSLWVPRTGAAAANTLYVVHQGALQRSTDGGFTFAPLATIDAGASEAILTGSEAGGTILYAAMNNGGTWTLHRSTAGGASFTPKSTLTDFWGPLCASILNQDLVCYGGVEARRSLNGGASFSLINTWQAYYNAPSTKLHADLWGIYCFPDPVNAAQERWYFATDGGLYHSTTQTITVSNLSLSGLGVSQYYATHTSTVNPNTIQAGAQDQGYQRGTYVTPTGSGPSTPFVQMISGDYGHLTSGNGAHGVVYSVYPGFLMVVTGETNSVVADMADFPAGANYEWLPPLAADPLNVNQCMFGANQLWRYVKSGNSWSPQLHSTFNFATGGGSYLTMIAFAPTDPQRMYATNDGGRLFWSTDHGVNWTQSASIAPGEHYFYGNAPRGPSDQRAGGGRRRIRVQQPRRLSHDQRWPDVDAAVVGLAADARLRPRVRREGRRLRRDRDRRVAVGARERPVGRRARRRRADHHVLVGRARARQERHALRYVRPRHLGLRNPGVLGQRRHARHRLSWQRRIRADARARRLPVAGLRRHAVDHGRTRQFDRSVRVRPRERRVSRSARAASCTRRRCCRSR
jgi:hypothetical protein